MALFLETSPQPNMKPMEPPFAPPAQLQPTDDDTPTDFCSFAELSEALQETVVSPPPHLAQLLAALKRNKIDLPTFCRAVRASLGQGVLLKAVQRVADKKEARSNWDKARTYAHSATALLDLSARHSGMGSSAPTGSEVDAESVPPIKRFSMREQSLREGSVKRSHRTSFGDHMPDEADEELSVKRKVAE